MAEEKVNKFAPKKVVADEKTKTAKVVEAKPAAAVKSAKPVKEVKTEVKEKAPASDKRTITVLAEKNPKREGSASYDRFQLYYKNKTVEKFLAAGGTSADLRYDQKNGYVSIAE